MTNSVLDTNKMLVKQLFAAIDVGDEAAFMALLHPDHYVEISGSQRIPSREKHWQMAQGHKSVYSDMHHIPEMQYAEGDQVVTRGRITGTNDGPYYGNPPTGKKIDIAFINICRIVDNRICGIYSLFDLDMERKQLGYKIELVKE